MRFLNVLPILIVSFIFLKPGNAQEKLCKLEIEVPAGEFDSLNYYISKGALQAYPIWLWETEYIDSSGKLSLEIETDTINWLFVTFYPTDYKGYEFEMKCRVFMYVQPGKRYSIVYDSTYNLLFKLHGYSAEANTLFNKLSHTLVSPRTSWFENTDTTVNDFILSLKDSISKSLKPYEELYLNEKIDKEYYDAIQNKIEYLHAESLLDGYERRKRKWKNPKHFAYEINVHPLKLSDIEEDRLYSSIYEMFPPTRDNAKIMKSQGKYLDRYLEHQLIKDSVMNSISSSYKDRLRKVDASAEYLNEEQVELYFAEQLSSSYMKSGPDSLATFLYREFKNRYPYSKYMPGIISNITLLTNAHLTRYPGLDDYDESDAHIQSYNQYIFSPEIVFIEKSDSIYSIKSLLNQFKGKNVFIDFWASWCGTCLYEFRMSELLDNFLNENGIVKLYVSSDADQDRWLNVIKNYNLEGYHYRVSDEEMRNDYYLSVDFLPTYMIMDSTGKIVATDVELPHTKEKLINQIKESLELE